MEGKKEKRKEDDDGLKKRKKKNVESTLSKMKRGKGNKSRNHICL